MGLGEPDDAAVYRLDDERAVISTVDFFPPVVDDPYDFGAIAAANALSDVYAMGGDPLMAINLVAFPDGLDTAILSEILRGGAEKVREAGAVIAGGHTVTDKEPKYGLAVTGQVHPARILTKGGACDGDVLVLTKSLGTGVITTALKNGQAEAEHVAAVTASMTRLNRHASEVARQVEVHAMTDVTGYGLMGHSIEVAAASKVDLSIRHEALSWLPGAESYAKRELYPGGMWRNEQYYRNNVQFNVKVPDYLRYLLFDPQTSGGLLMAVAPAVAAQLVDALHNGGETASVIGEARSGPGRIIIE